MTSPGLRGLLAVSLLTALAVPACGGSEKRAQPRPTAPTTVPSTTTTTTPPPPTFPLTGRPVGEGGDPGRPAVTVKIDNSVAARPQSGVDKADLVYEEFTEGITRFIVVFHSADAEVVGPVRSVRPADPAVVTPLGGILAFSGGSPAAEALAASAPVTRVTEKDLDVMYRRPGRAAPHNLYTSTQGLLSKAPADAPAPPKFAEFLAAGQSFTAAGATPVAHLSLVPATYVTADYDWDGSSGTWKRSTDGRPHPLEGDVQAGPTNVVVQYTPYSEFAGDSSVQFPEVVGSGEALVLAAGTMVKGSWSKPSPEAVTTFADANGAAIVFPPGQTWVHLLSPDSAVTAT